MLFTINRARLFGLLVSASLLVYSFTEVALTFACPSGTGNVCGG